MSETNKLTSPPFPEVCNCVNSTQAELANFSDVNLLQEQITAVHSATTTLDATEYTEANCCAGEWSTFPNWMEETDNCSASPTAADVASLVALIQDIRVSNTNLLERTIELEQSLAESGDDLLIEKARSHNAESILNEKIDTLTAVQKQVHSLSKQLETAHQTVQQQQASIKNLTTQLVTSSERIAQMERECSLTQSNYNEKSHQLMQSENSSRELRSRLIRQQRYTMQLKVALEKSLDSPVGSYQSQDCNDFSKQAESVFPQAQPITPWSVPTPSFTNELEPTWTGSSVNSQPYFDCTPSTSVERGFFYTKDFDVDREDTNWQDVFTLLDETEVETNNSEIDLFVAKTVSTPHTEGLAELDMLLEEPTAFSPNSKSISEPVLAQTNQCSQDSSEPKTKSTQVNSNWPSPVVYPLHPPKGRKSLSAIELPKFTQKRK